MNVRRMNVEDIDEIKKLDSLVFSAYRTGIRKSENILSNLKSNPEGCFVIEEDKIIGYIFSHLWGELAWIGTFGIHPNHQGQGMGKKLFTTALAYLNNQGCSIIGLETLSDSSYNIGMYLNLGFNPIYPTLVFRKSLFESPTKIKVNEEINFDTVSKLSRTILKELDYTSEVKNAMENGWGKAIFFGDANPYGFAVLRFSSMMEDQSEKTATVNTMVINSVSEGVIMDTIKQIEAFTITNNLKELIIPVNTLNYNAVQCLLKCGYKIQRNIVRMIYKGKYQNLKGVDLSRWAM